LGSFQYFEGEGPVFELESEEKLKIENFSYSLITYMFKELHKYIFKVLNTTLTAVTKSLADTHF
jgi:hypothetical protein